MRASLLYVLAGIILLAPLARWVTIAVATHGDFAFFFLLPSRADVLA
jgi:hypothetical protein